MRQLLGSSVTYRIAVGPQAGRKALVLRTITALAVEDPRNERVAKAQGFSLHAGVSCEAHQRQLRERLCRYDVQGCTSVAGGRMPGATIARPAVAEKRLNRGWSGMDGSRRRPVCFAPCARVWVPIDLKQLALPGSTPKLYPSASRPTAALPARNVWAQGDS